jgi:hypothetical protein
MAEVAIELCDGLPSYVEEKVDEFVERWAVIVPGPPSSLSCKTLQAGLTSRPQLGDSRESHYAPGGDDQRLPRLVPGVWELRSLLGHRVSVGEYCERTEAIWVDSEGRGFEPRRSPSKRRPAGRSREHPKSGAPDEASGFP